MQPHPTDDASDAAWAANLRPLLGMLQARDVRLLPDTPAGAAVEWRDGKGEATRGWLLRLGRSNRSGPAVFVATASRGAASERDLHVAGALCRLAWHVRGEHADLELADPIDDAVHAMRNALNGAVMNAAVLASRADALPDNLREVARRIDDATSRSAQELHRLVALIEMLR